MSKNKNDTVLDTLDAIESDEDLLQMFTKSVTDMSADELELVYTKIQARRKKKIPRGREKTELDIMLGKLTPELAQVVLQRLMEKENEEAAANENKEDNVEDE